MAQKYHRINMTTVGDTCLDKYMVNKSIMSQSKHAYSSTLFKGQQYHRVKIDRVVHGSQCNNIIE